MNRAVVTGGAGFIGSHVVGAFLEDGVDVLAIDDLSTGDQARLDERASFRRLDILDDERLTEVIAEFDPDAVCHLAAQASVTVSVRDPAHDLDVNVRGTFHVCRAAASVGAQVIFASTGAVYGDRAPVPTTEGVPLQPMAPYGASKLGGEAYVGTWGRFHDLPNVALRLANVYGPRQSTHGEAGVVAIFSDRLRRGVPPSVFGDGTQTRDYVHVSDVARAFVLAGVGGRPGTFNVGCGVETPVLEVLDVLQAAADTAVDLRFEPLRVGELLRSALDPTAIGAAFGWTPSVRLEDGLKETYGSYAALASE